MVLIMNLNIWNYNKFDIRKKLIVNFIKKHNPDIINFQEIRDDSRRDRKGDNQLKQLNRLLKYPYMKFFETMDVNVVNKKLNDSKYDASNPRVKEGVAILSKFKILKSKGFKLAQHQKDAYTRGILWAKIKAEQNIDVIVVHYSANDLFSKLHLKETLDFAQANSIYPIIIGDFNIRKIKIAHQLASKNFIVSRDKFEYYSFPNKKETLDYILIPKNYLFKKFQAIGHKISDHKALLADIQI